MDQLSINKNRIDLDEAYLQMAEIWAKRSKAVRKQVGALIVKDNQIISDGYNGMPRNTKPKDEVCEYWSVGQDNIPKLMTKKAVLHGESNAILKLARNGSRSAEGATLYVTMSPCEDCAKLIIQAGIKRVVFRELYRETDGVDFLKQYNVDVVQLWNILT